MTSTLLISLLALNGTPANFSVAKPHPFPSGGSDPWGYVTWGNGPVSVASEPEVDFLDRKTLDSQLAEIKVGKNLLAQVEKITPYAVAQRKTDKLVHTLREYFYGSNKPMLTDKYLASVDPDVLWAVSLATSVDGHVTSFTVNKTSYTPTHGLEGIAQFAGEQIPRTRYQEWARLISCILAGKTADARKYSNSLCIKYPNSQGLYLIRLRTWLEGNTTDALPDSKKVTSMLNDAINRWPNYPRLWYLYGALNGGEVRKKYWAKYRAAKTGTFKFELERMKEFEKQN
jgi:hypothetical protein